MAGRLVLVQEIGVRIPVRQPHHQFLTTFCYTKNMFSDWIKDYKNSSMNNPIEYIVRRLSVAFYNQSPINKQSTEAFELETEEIREQDNVSNAVSNYNIDKRRIIWTTIKAIVVFVAVVLGSFLLTSIIIFIFNSEGNAESNFSYLGTIIVLINFAWLARRANRAQEEFLKYFQITFKPKTRVYPSYSIFAPKNMLFVMGISSISQPNEKIEVLRQDLIQKTYHFLYFLLLWMPLSFLFSFLGLP